MWDSIFEPVLQGEKQSTETPIFLSELVGEKNIDNNI